MRWLVWGGNHGLRLSSNSFAHGERRPVEAFTGRDVAILVYGFPRRQGMLRKDLIAKNAPIFGGMGKAIDENAKADCKVLVVANASEHERAAAARRSSESR